MCEPGPLVRLEGTASDLLAWTGDDHGGEEPRSGPVACCYTSTPTKASPLIPTDPPTAPVCQLGFQPLAAKCLPSGRSSGWPLRPPAPQLQTPPRLPLGPFTDIPTHCRPCSPLPTVVFS